MQATFEAEEAEVQKQIEQAQRSLRIRITPCHGWKRKAYNRPTGSNSKNQRMQAFVPLRPFECGTAT